jgi:hypothetical protein
VTYKAVAVVGKEVAMHFVTVDAIFLPWVENTKCWQARGGMAWNLILSIWTFLLLLAICSVTYYR